MTVKLLLPDAPALKSFTLNFEYLYFLSLTFVSLTLDSLTFEQLDYIFF